MAFQPSNVKFINLLWAVFVWKCVGSIWLLVVCRHCIRRLHPFCRICEAASHTPLMPRGASRPGGHLCWHPIDLSCDERRVVCHHFSSPHLVSKIFNTCYLFSKRGKGLSLSILSLSKVKYLKYIRNSEKVPWPLNFFKDPCILIMVGTWNTKMCMYGVIIFSSKYPAPLPDMLTISFPQSLACWEEVFLF